ncbi:hypothetical protein GCM10010320_71880 [Streptomyces caelestis]|nr:hypothetical protein GCM10010320_71880 [Streptomyces caelestis]
MFTPAKREQRPSFVAECPSEGKRLRPAQECQRSAVRFLMPPKTRTNTTPTSSLSSN